MKIDLFIMTYKGLVTLEALIKDNHLSILNKVIIGKDNNVINDYSSEIEQLCLTNGIDYADRVNYKKTDNVDLIIAISWRWMIKNDDIKLIVLHDSILPKYRGFSPLVNMLINIENTIGVTALYANDEYDRGEIIKQRTVDVTYPIKIVHAIEKIAILYGEIISEIIEEIMLSSKLPKSNIQNEDEATYSLWRDEFDYKIVWKNNSDYISNFINALSFPYKGAYAFIDDKKVRILDAEEFEDVKIENRDVGKIIFLKDEKPIVVCGSGLLKINKMIDDETKMDILPLNKFRIKFS